MPRKVADEDLLQMTAEGFNEAGAVMPRKPGQTLIWCQYRAASMRPGLLCPGSQLAPRAQHRHIAGFNEAGAVMPRKLLVFQRAVGL